MDESWRMKMGMPFTATTKNDFRHSTEFTTHRRREISGDSKLEPEDFNDVFGGPPRSVLHRQFSGDDYTKSSSNLYYEEMFRPPARTCRNFPEFRIPVEKSCRVIDRGFYGDIFGCEEDDMVRRSRTRSGSKSKASSSSVLSSEDVSPLRPVLGRDCYDDVSFLTSKLRPINVPVRWNSTRKMHEEEYQEVGVMRAFTCYPQEGWVKNTKAEHNEDFKSSNLVFNRRNASPESISLDPISSSSHKVSPRAFELHSPSSVVSSSLCKDHEDNKACSGQDDMSLLEMSEQDEDEIMSSYVIEINPDYREGTEEEIAVNEAIAWAKEKFQAHCSENNLRTEEERQQSREVSTLHQFSDEQRDGHELTGGTLDEELDKRATGEERLQLQNDMATELLDEKLRLWSSGKEADTRLLLSTLHHIVWPESGWLPIPVTNLMDNVHVKKAYQKARLCLHPDKLQQRNATFPQKYVAEKAFSILQDAWEAFISQNVIFGHRE